MLENNSARLNQTMKQLCKILLVNRKTSIITSEPKVVPKKNLAKIDYLKVERIIVELEVKLFQLKAGIVKWVIGISMIQILINFALNCWGLN